MKLEDLYTTKSYAHKILPRQEELTRVYIHCTGGIRFIEDAGKWFLSPFLGDDGLYTIGPFTKENVLEIADQLKMYPIGYEKTRYRRFVEDYSFIPLAYSWGEPKQKISRSWQFAAVNRHLPEIVAKTKEGAISLGDPHAIPLHARSKNEPISRYAERIGVSLENADNALRELCHGYHNNLLERLAVWPENSRLLGSKSDQSIAPAVSALLVNLAAARDYLAGLIAHELKLPKDVDCLSRLLREKHQTKLRRSDRIKFLLSTEALVLEGREIKAGPVLEALSKYRNDVTHSNHFDVYHEETTGNVTALDPGQRILRYVKRIAVRRGKDADMLDTFSEPHTQVSRLFGDLFFEMDLNGSPLTFMRDDIGKFELYDTNRLSEAMKFFVGAPPIDHGRF